MARNNNVDAIILACMEIPLALTEETFENIPLIDAPAILAESPLS